jgi:hypothetical protein
MPAAMTVNADRDEVSRLCTKPPMVDGRLVAAPRGSADT